MIPSLKESPFPTIRKSLLARSSSTWINGKNNPLVQNPTYNFFGILLNRLPTVLFRFSFCYNQQLKVEVRKSTFMANKTTY